MDKKFACYTPSPYFDFRECKMHDNSCNPSCDDMSPFAHIATSPIPHQNQVGIAIIFAVFHLACFGLQAVLFFLILFANKRVVFVQKFA